MRSWSLSMRWWLGFAFALVAAGTAVAVAQGMANRSEKAFREDAERRSCTGPTSCLSICDGNGPK